MTEQSTVGRDIGWYEARHVQMARAIGNYRRNIKQLQRAHDRQQAHWSAMFHRWSAERDENRKLRDEIVNLRRVPKDRRWNRDVAFVTLGVFLGLAGLLIAALLNRAMLR